MIILVLWFTGSPCCNFSYYNYISIWPYYIVIHFTLYAVTMDINSKIITHCDVLMSHGTSSCAHRGNSTNSSAHRDNLHQTFNSKEAIIWHKTHASNASITWCRRATSGVMTSSLIITSHVLAPPSTLRLRSVPTAACLTVRLLSTNSGPRILMMFARSKCGIASGWFTREARVEHAHSRSSGPVLRSCNNKWPDFRKCHQNLISLRMLCWCWKLIWQFVRMQMNWRVGPNSKRGFGALSPNYNWK